MLSLFLLTFQSVDTWKQRSVNLSVPQELEVCRILSDCCLLSVCCQSVSFLLSTCLPVWFCECKSWQETLQSVTFCLCQKGNCFTIFHTLVCTSSCLFSFRMFKLYLSGSYCLNSKFNSVQITLQAIITLADFFDRSYMVGNSCDSNLFCFIGAVLIQCWFC